MGKTSKVESSSPFKFAKMGEWFGVRVLQWTIRIREPGYLPESLSEYARVWLSSLDCIYLNYDLH